MGSSAILNTGNESPIHRTQQPAWQRVILLIVLAYEGLGAVAGGIMLMAEPDGRLMDMPVSLMRGAFPDFMVPGIILFALGILNAIAFFAVFRKTRRDWVWAALAMGGLAIWFIVEIIILQQLHWLHAMWGLPVLIGCLIVYPMVSHSPPRHFSPLGQYPDPDSKAN